MNTINATPTTPAEHRAIELRKEGMSIENIMKETGVPDRRIKALTKGIVKPKKGLQRAPKTLKPFDKAFERVFPLACRLSGIRNYELRDILHQEYRSTWNSSSGHYESNYTDDTIKRIKAKARKRAFEEDRSAIFTPDWIDECSPRSSFDFMVSTASDLRSRAEEYVAEYMEVYGTRQGDDSDDGVIARTKQRYATLRFLWKLAVPDYGKEPLGTLLKRSVKLVSELEGDPDIEHTGYDEVEQPDYYPEPSGRDHFLDYVEAQGWI
ncbi:hypothetical protein [Pseudomonas putida]|uniref:hypothetical protein n=1 Tax=Pseudomonas putida TaxID=303 RepID=UPI0018D5D142|nr:hypothetical protein [Pseudomonas putida]MBH3420128.1 hypothetical protein [Pseudomonas putida]MDG9818211.1 hypothetical protein [Pseudomonas putida]